MFEDIIKEKLPDIEEAVSKGVVCIIGSEDTIVGIIALGKYMDALFEAIKDLYHKEGAAFMVVDIKTGEAETYKKSIQETFEFTLPDKCDIDNYAPVKKHAPKYRCDGKEKKRKFRG